MFEGNNLVASGVLMEAYSVQDAGAGVMFCVYVYTISIGDCYKIIQQGDLSGRAGTQTTVYGYLLQCHQNLRHRFLIQRRVHKHIF